MPVTGTAFTVSCGYDKIVLRGRTHAQRRFIVFRRHELPVRHIPHGNGRRYGQVEIEEFFLGYVPFKIITVFCIKMITELLFQKLVHSEKSAVRTAADKVYALIFGNDGITVAAEFFFIDGNTGRLQQSGIAQRDILRIGGMRKPCIR